MSLPPMQLPRRSAPNYDQEEGQGISTSDQGFKNSFFGPKKCLAPENYSIMDQATGPTLSDIACTIELACEHGVNSLSISPQTSILRGNPMIGATQPAEV